MGPLARRAAGAVGQALLVLGRLAGLEVWGTARGAHAALIRELGLEAQVRWQQGAWRWQASGMLLDAERSGSSRDGVNGLR